MAVDENRVLSHQNWQRMRKVIEDSTKKIIEYITPIASAVLMATMLKNDVSYSVAHVQALVGCVTLLTD